MPEFEFAAEIRVRFAETDAQGIAHHAAYPVWFEVARVAYLAEFAGGYQALRDQGIESPVIELSVRYLAPAHFDDRLLVHAHCHDPRGARFRFSYLVERDGTPIAEGSSRHALVDAHTRRPIRVPPWLAEVISGIESRGVTR
jgi:acyl-CoA thioester hydrolase